MWAVLRLGLLSLRWYSGVRAFLPTAKQTTTTTTIKKKCIDILNGLAVKKNRKQVRTGTVGNNSSRSGLSPGPLHHADMEKNNLSCIKKFICQELPNVHVAARYKYAETHPHTYVRAAFALIATSISSASKCVSQPVKPVVINLALRIKNVTVSEIYLFENIMAW